MSSDPRPNVLLITTDQQRYDMLGANGNTQVRTPHLDALAARGARFTHATIQNTVCIPSRACLQTGRYTHQHGVTYMESVIDDTPGLPAWERTFMERLQGAGYRTGAFGKIHMMPEKGFHEMQVTGGKGARWTQSAGLPVGLAPLGRDYAAWLEARHPGGYEAIYEQRRRPEYRQYHTAISNVLPLEQYVDYWIAENTRDFICRDHGRPFFAWCGFCGPHGPVDPPRPYDTLYEPEEIVLPANWAVDDEGNPRATTAEQEWIARRWCAYYMGLVTLIDDMVGRLVEALKGRGLLENTLILFTTDHGEMMFERGRLGKGNFTEAVIRAPLIVTAPGSGRAGRVVEGLVETYDVAPTVLDYARAEVPATMSARTLRPLIEGTGSGKDLALCEYLSNDRSERGICVRTERFKYEYWSPSERERFYDLQADPLERRDLIAQAPYRDEIERHRLLMIDRLMNTPA
jgi:arylsulfatase A-like enzyme